MNNIVVTRSSMTIILARKIKSYSTDLKTCSQKEIEIKFNWGNRTTGLTIEGDHYVLSGIMPLEELCAMVDDAIDMTKQECRVTAYNDRIRLIMLGKPVKEFTTLKRLLSKYSKFTLGWLDVHSKTMNEYGIVHPEDVKYLCYDSNLCKEASDFIKANRTSKDSLVPEIISKIQDEGKVTRFSLRIRNETPKGKVKAECDFEV